MVQLLTALCLLVARAPQNQGYYMQPSVHGDSIVFVSQGDLWLVGAEGGTARELTSHVAPASSPWISADGASVAYTATYEGPSDVYVMPIEGGLPKRLTYGGGMNVVGWTPDGKVIAATYMHSTLPSPLIVSIDPATRRQTEFPVAKASDGCLDPAGQTLFFTRFAFQGSQTKRYKGGTAQSLWRYTTGTPEAIPLTKSFIGTSKNPMLVGNRVFFLSDRDGVMNVWSMNETGGDLSQVSHSRSWDVQTASVNGNRVVYQLGADLHSCDLTGKGDHVVPITLSSDFDQTREHWIKDPFSYITSVAASADGEKVALTARGQVFVAPVEPGRLVETTRKSGVRYRNAIFMPDGKSVLALSDESGETEWWQMPANGVGAATQLTTGSKVLGLGGQVSPDGKHLAYADKDYNLWVLDIATKKAVKAITSDDGTISDLHWSPDSQWVAYQFPTKSFDRLQIYSLATGKNTPVTSPNSESRSPAWSPDGKWLYFISDRTFRSVVSSPWGDRLSEPFFDKQSNIYALGLVKDLRSPFQPGDELFTAPKPKPATGPVKVEIDMDGLLGRLWQVPIPAGNYSRLVTNGEKLFFISVDRSGPPSVVAVDIANKDIAAKTIATAVSFFEISQDGKRLVIAKAPSGIYSISSGAPGVGPTDKPVDLSNWTFPIDPIEEWHQMFVEAWRLERDYFYDRNMHGVDWPAILHKYSPLVDRVRDRAELSNLLAQMVGELSALHTFVYGGDVRGPVDLVAPASLGAELSRDAAAGGYRVDKIYAGEPDYPETFSPLARPDVHVGVGDVITAVNGQDALSAPDLSALLRTEAGHQVLIHVKDHGTGGQRDCIVVPMDSGAASNLRYTDWEVSRRNIVESQSKGTMGYVHLRAMGSGDIAQWERDFYPAFDRQGLIIDVRHNGGGNIDSWIIENLLRKAWMYWQDRIGNPTWNMQKAFRGHVVVLCDENTASDGEAFCEGIKRLGLGKVIGTRTWGGEIWLSSSNVLRDHGIATAAESGVYGPDGIWLVEGHGVDPDIVVDDLPHASYMGQDAQLQAALDYLAKEIKDHPVPVPPAPKHPNKSFPPSQGIGG